MAELTLIQQVKHARRVSVPLVAITTPDPAATLDGIAAAINGVAPIISWDTDAGVVGVNGAGETLAEKLGGRKMAGNPLAILSQAAAVVPPKAILAILQADAWLDDPMVKQAVWNLRDAYKVNHRMLVLLADDLTLPGFLRNDVVQIDEPLPTAKQLEAIVVEADKSASVCPECRGSGKAKGLACEACKETGINPKRPLLKGDSLARAVEGVAGLAAFPAEQAVSMALRPDGVDLDHLWATKRKAIEQTRGLSVYYGGETFEDLGGLGEIKSYLTDVMEGREPPRVVVWLDEIEKSGLAHDSDLSGVNADQLGTVLSYMEDTEAFGVLAVGVAGSGKAAIWKAVGSTFGRMVIRLDLGAMQGSLVGESQQNIRQALKVITGVGGESVLWIATSNSVEGLDTALRSRFVDTYFFDLPSADERKPIWEVWLKRYPEVDREQIDDEGWVGRNIRQAVQKAWKQRKSLGHVAQRIIPQAIVEGQAIERLRAEADGRYLSASYPGVYRAPQGVASGPGRAVDLTE